MKKVKLDFAENLDRGDLHELGKRYPEGLIKSMIQPVNISGINPTFECGNSAPYNKYLNFPSGHCYDGIQDMINHNPHLAGKPPYEKFSVDK